MAIIVVLELTRSIRILVASELAILWMQEEVHYEVLSVKIALNVSLCVLVLRNAMKTANEYYTFTLL